MGVPSEGLTSLFLSARKNYVKLNYYINEIGKIGEE